LRQMRLIAPLHTRMEHRCQPVVTCLARSHISIVRGCIPQTYIYSSSIPICSAVLSIFHVDNGRAILPKFFLEQMRAPIKHAQSACRGEICGVVRKQMGNGKECSTSA
jgi:hypothetical protein